MYSTWRDEQNKTLLAYVLMMFYTSGKLCDDFALFYVATYVYIILL